MDGYIAPLANLIEQFKSLPGIGHKTARRLSFYILSRPQEEAERFAEALTDAKKLIKYCKICQNITDTEICAICDNEKRDQSVICVLENSRDVISFEKTKEFSGLYHILHGVISPMADISPADIKLAELLERLKSDIVTEIILALNPTVEGEATSMYIAKLIKPLGIKVTRIAHGIPVGGDLEFADEVTLAKALEGRREM